MRPLSKESELQNLAHTPIEELRPAFQDQVKQLRRKVLQRIKAKTVKGKDLTGRLLIGLARQYVNAINRGAVPNIESAWTYICLNECQKALEEVHSNF